MPRPLHFFALFLALLLPSAASATPSLHTTTTLTQTIGPVIGVVAQPKKSTLIPCDGTCEYIAASYVKWVESAGGRVLPIPYDASPKDLDTIFASVNGLLFPGGSNLISKGAKYLFSRARQANEAGDFFPVWGTCLGLEWMVEAVCAEAEENDPSIPHFIMDSDYDAWNLTLPLLFTESASISRLFQGLNPSLLSAAAHGNLTLNNHHKGVAPAHLEATPALSTFFDVLSTNFDRAGLPFVSTVEGKDGMPFYGVQFHPEKAMFEWGVEGGGEGGKEDDEVVWPYEAINHSPAAQALSRYLAEFLIGEARKNGHVFPEARGGEVLSWAYPVVYSGPEFVQSYFFHEYHFPGKDDDGVKEEGGAAVGPVGEERDSEKALRGTKNVKSSSGVLLEVA
jgi:gamma-glutamyl hydrolase